MSRWPFIVDGEHGSLLNRWSTEIRLSRRARVDVLAIFDRMEELDVPFGYTDELDEIYFTLLPHKHGDYSPCIIRLSTSHDSLRSIDRTLVHELGHHMDAIEDLSERPSLIEEKRSSARFMSDSYARHDVGEYVAVGFEVYYLGTDEQRRKMREHNPRLYRTIREIHKKYSRR